MLVLSGAYSPDSLCIRPYSLEKFRVYYALWYRLEEHDLTERLIGVGGHGARRQGRSLGDTEEGQRRDGTFD